MTEEKKDRPKVTGVTVNLLYPDGATRTITIDPTITEALFWSDRAIKEIFAPYYEKHPRVVPKDELIKRLGARGERLIGIEDKVKVDKEFVEKLWEKEEPGGYLLAMLSKSIDCLPG
jgi:hypothetical protein